IAAGKGVKVNNPKGVLTEKAVGLYADLSKLTPLSNMKEEDAQLLALFKSFYGNANLDGGKFTLELTDKSQNALKIITVAVGSILAEQEKAMDPDLEAELEEAVEKGEDAFDKLDEELKDVDLNKTVDEVKEAIEHK